MSEIEKNGVGTPSISKEAKAFDNLPLDSTIQGIKTASFLDRQIAEKEKEQRESRRNPVKEEMPVPTGSEIREDREEGEYR